MNLWGRKCFPRPTPPPSWLLPPTVATLILVSRQEPRSKETGPILNYFLYKTFYLKIFHCSILCVLKDNFPRFTLDSSFNKPSKSDGIKAPDFCGQLNMHIISSILLQMGKKKKKKERHMRGINRQGQCSRGGHNSKLPVGEKKRKNTQENFQEL